MGSHIAETKPVEQERERKICQKLLQYVLKCTVIYVCCPNECKQICYVNGHILSKSVGLAFGDVFFAESELF